MPFRPESTTYRPALKSSRARLSNRLMTTLARHAGAIRINRITLTLATPLSGML